MCFKYFKFTWLCGYVFYMASYHCNASGLHASAKSLVCKKMFLIRFWFVCFVRLTWTSTWPLTWPISCPPCDDAMPFINFLFCPSCRYFFLLHPVPAVWFTHQIKHISQLQCGYVVIMAIGVVMWFCLKYNVVVWLREWLRCCMFVAHYNDSTLMNFTNNIYGASMRDSNL